ncbi:MAG: fibronectin type III domain-containing protein [Ignavibacteria bacterium]|nr:fibronectin type III domain-containing protein [Ignavibacteria bacterium]
MKYSLVAVFVLVLILSHSGCGDDNSSSSENSPPTSPNLISPPNGSIDSVNVLNFTWSSSQNASSYRIQISMDSGFTQLLADTTLTATSYDFTASLQPSTIYYWRVCAINSYGQGSYSNIWSFITASIVITQTIEGYWVLVYSAGSLDVCPGEEVRFPNSVSGTAELKCPNQSMIYRNYTVSAGILTYTASGIRYLISFTQNSELVLSGINNNRILYYALILPRREVEVKGGRSGWNSSE